VLGAGALSELFVKDSARGGDAAVILSNGEAGRTGIAGVSRTQELNVRDRPDNADGKGDRGRTNRQDDLGEPSNGVEVVSLKLHRVSFGRSALL
jgi:hypothetical protein